MKKKSILYILFVCVGGGLLASCDDYLDKLPDNRTDLDSEAKIADLLVSAYPDTHFAAACELMSDNTDEEEGQSALSQFQEELASWRDPTSMEQDCPYFIWSEYYTSIAACNNVLKAIEQRGNPPSLSPQRGEALVCRAYLHFILVNLFSMAYNPQTADTDLGVPYMTQIETTVNPHYDRGTVAETYRRIEADLNEGLPLIDDNAYDVPKYHFNRRAAQAFACRFWLYYVQPDKSNYRKVIDYASQVLTDQPATMLRDWKTLGTYNMLNDAAQHEFVDVKDNANLLLVSTHSLWQRLHYGNGLKYGFNIIIWNLEMEKPSPWGWLNDGGVLGSALFHYPWMQTNTSRRLIFPKLCEMFEYADMMSGEGYPHVIFPVLQTDEALLSRAEAHIMLKQYQKGLDDMNLFMQNFSHTRGATTLTRMATLNSVDSIYGDYIEGSEGEPIRGMKYYAPKSPTEKKRLHPAGFVVEHGLQESMIHCVLHLRRILTLHEGLRWFDIKRYGMTVYRRQIGGNFSYTPNKDTGEHPGITVTDSMLPDDPRRALQLPISVINAGLTPNPR